MKTLNNTSQMNLHLVLYKYLIGKILAIINYKLLITTFCIFFSFALLGQNDLQTFRNLLEKGNLEEAIELSQKLEKSVVKESISQAQFWNLEAELWLKKGQNEKALDKAQNSLNLYESKFSEKEKEVAKVYNNLGLIYWNTRNQQLALEYLSKALDIRQKDVAKNQKSIASSYNNIGLVYSQSQEFEQALTYYQKALNIYQKLYQENDVKLVNIYNNLAVVHQEQENFEEAERFFGKSLAIYEKNYGANHVNIAFVYNYLARLKLLENAPKSAQEFAQKALKIYQEKYGVKHPEIAKTYLLLGNISQKIKGGQRSNVNQALHYYQQAILANTVKFSNTKYEQNPATQDYYDADVLLQSFLLKAQTLEELYSLSLRVKHLNLAMENLEKCDTLIGKIRQARTSKADKIALGKTAHQVYEDAIRISLNLSEVTTRKNFYVEKAFVFSEKNRVSVLLSAISETNAKSFANIPQSLIEEEKTLKSHIAELEQQLLEKPTQTLEQKYRNQLFELNRKYESFVKNLEQKYPQYYNLKYQLSFASVANLQQSLRANEAILSYFVAQKTERVFIFKITSKGLSYQNVAKIESLEKFVKALRNGIKYKVKKLFSKYAFTIYEQLFPKNFVKNSEKLIIIPDGILSAVPFESLLTAEDEDFKTPYTQLPYLIRKHSISYAYSATLFYQTRQNSRPLDMENSKILITAPVSFEQNFLNTLPATQTEALEIEKLFQNRSKILMEEKAQEKILKTSDLKNYDFLHFPTHGTVNEDNPELSAIFLRKDAQEDGILYSGEIYNLELNASLVTLSACETGLGKISRGEGIIGLTRALLYAGAKNMLVSLWTVSDNSTSTLMIDFYKNLQTQNSFSQTLRTAKLKMLTNEEFALPYYWAAFILVGE